MRVLDIDLDFFMHGVVYNVPCKQKRRQSKKQYHAWSIKETEKYLKENLKLKTKRPGMVYDDHRDLFIILENLIDDKSISTPFELVHVDSHADMGNVFDGSLNKTLTDYAGRTKRGMLNKSTKLYDNNSLNCSNHLLYILLNRWIRKLTYVKNPESDSGDIHIFYKYKGKEDARYLQFCQYNTELFEAPKFIRFSPNFSRYKPVKCHRKIEYNEFISWQYENNRKYDFIFLATSKGYTTEQSDSLIPYIREYIDESISVVRRRGNE